MARVQSGKPAESLPKVLNSSWVDHGAALPGGVKQVDDISLFLDGPWIGPHPDIAHGAAGDLVELGPLHASVAQARGHAQALDQPADGAGAVTVAAPQGARDLGQFFGPVRAVEAHHVRQHHAAGVAVAHAGHGTQAMAYAMA